MQDGRRSLFDDVRQRENLQEALNQMEARFGRRPPIFQVRGGGAVVKTAGAQASPGALRPLNGPEPMRVKPDEDGHPQQVSIRSEWLRVESIVDLWRIEDEWWRERPVSRSYYDVRLGGWPQAVHLPGRPHRGVVSATVWLSTPSFHCHSNFSFQEGASSVGKLVLRAKELGYGALALTDHDNLCGAMELARTASSLGMRSITGAEVSLEGGAHLTLLATSPQGYSNLCRLLSYSRVFKDRRHPELDLRLLPDHAKGLILLSGCSQGPIPRLLAEDRIDEARATARQYQEWFGLENVYLELQQNLVYGDTQRIRRLVQLGHELDIPVVATNNAHYHTPERHRLQDCLVAIGACKSLEETHRERRPNAEFHLKSPQQMARLFRGCAGGHL